MFATYLAVDHAMIKGKCLACVDDDLDVALAAGQ